MQQKTRNVKNKQENVKKIMDIFLFFGKIIAIGLKKDKKSTSFLKNAFKKFFLNFKMQYGKYIDYLIVLSV